jgi:hypothetical protein
MGTICSAEKSVKQVHDTSHESENTTQQTARQVQPQQPQQQQQPVEKVEDKQQTEQIPSEETHVTEPQQQQSETVTIVESPNVVEDNKETTGSVLLSQDNKDILPQNETIEEHRLLEMTSNHHIQTTNTVLMVRPVDFAFNAETAVDNEFQHTLENESVLDIALSEFENSVQILRQENITVLVLEKEENESTEERIITPDAVFPNNWFGTGRDSKLIVYTMATANRRAEARRLDDVRELLEKSGCVYDPLPLILENEFQNDDSSDYSDNVVEGTGALVIDHISGTVYAAKSVRCSPSALDKYMHLRSNVFKKSILFQTKSSTGKEFYHTNVLLSIGTEFAVVCSQCIRDDPDHPSCLSRGQVLEELSKSRVVIDITLEQAEKYFCANILELRGNDNQSKIIMSTTSYSGFTDEQRQQLSKFGKIVALPIPRIEYVGGGSARCMLAEVFFKGLLPSLARMNF